MTTGVVIAGAGIIVTGVAAGIALGTAFIMLKPVIGTGVGITGVGWVGGHPSGNPIPPPPPAP
jgi:hypothetical protein